jgi:hypothetical protein
LTCWVPSRDIGAGERAEPWSKVALQASTERCNILPALPTGITAEEVDLGGNDLN